MIKVNLITLGTVKEKYLSDACGEYYKRLSRYCDLKVTEIAPEFLPENPSDRQIEAALSKEGEKIEKQLPQNAFVTALCIEGKQTSSEQFAATLKNAENNGRQLCFIIGSSYGLCEKIKQKADLKLSFSQMTFPHRLFRVMLLEQLYRGFKINGGGAYHK